MSSLNIEVGTSDVRPESSAPIRSVSDVAQLINGSTQKRHYARWIVFLALGGVFLDAYDLTTLSYGIDDVVREFHLTPTLTGVVASAIMVGTIIGNLLGGWLTDKYGRYSVFMADMLFFCCICDCGRVSAKCLGTYRCAFFNGDRRWGGFTGSDGLSRRVFEIHRASE